ncbi:MAG TPA: hypothetical protein VL727_12425 [Puia sp.]|nr:hypothetical protein [Puia sp.]
MLKQLFGLLILSGAGLTAFEQASAQAGESMSQAGAGAPPSADINNGVIHARLYLPDTAVGYYRATRFDWSGVMPVLEYKGHQYITQWFPKYAPTIHDAILGPVESFTPLDFKGDFVQIGVGRLVRPDTAAYSPFKYYNIKDAGVWKVRTSRRAVEFRHRLEGYYEYTKTVELVKGKPELVLRHTLKNTGTKLIETDVYDHNFFRMDSGSTGPGLGLKYTFAPTADEVRGPAVIQGDSIVLERPLTGHESVYGVLHNGDVYDIRVENKETGIHIRGDKPISKNVYWGSPTILCPEPYIHIRVEPGESFSWTIHYEFYTK